MKRWKQGGSFPIGWANHPSVVAFRVTPGPTIRVRTPEQVEQERRLWRAERRARALWWCCVALWLAAIAWAVL